MADAEENGTSNGFGFMHAGMAACCAIMLVPVAGFFIAGGTVAGLGGNLLVFAPIALCIGVHVAMFAMMGKSCHGTPKNTAEDASFDDAEPLPVMVHAETYDGAR